MFLPLCRYIVAIYLFILEVSFPVEKAKSEPTVKRCENLLTSKVLDISCSLLRQFKM